MNWQLQQTREFIAAVTDGRRVGVLCSFGADSLVVAALTISVCPSAQVLFFPSEFTYAQPFRAAAARLGWPVLTYPARNAYPLTDERGGWHWIEERDVSGAALPFLRDLTPDVHGHCSRFGSESMLVRFNFDILLTGQRGTDTHPLWKGGICLPDGSEAGAAEMYAPLREWTADDVQEAIDALDLREFILQDDTVTACVECWRGCDGFYCERQSAALPPLMPMNARRAEFAAVFQV